LTKRTEGVIIAAYCLTLCDNVLSDIVW